MQYRINLGCWGSVFAVPSVVVDEHIKLAGAASLKVLLYLLRHSDENIDEKELSQRLSLSRGDTADALQYWTSCGVLAEREDSLVPAQLVSAEVNPQISQQISEQKNEIPAAPVKKTDIVYQVDEYTQIMAEDESVGDMLVAVGNILKKTLTHKEIAVFVTLQHWYGMPPDVICMLASYCMSIGKTNMAYIKSTGLGWLEEGIDSSEKAEEKIRNIQETRRAWITISDLFELPKRKPTANEEKCSTTWLNVWHMPAEMIKHAYDRCINAKGKLSFSYINGILSKWQTEGIFTVEKLEEAEQERRAKKVETKNDTGRYESTHDLNELDKLYWDEMMDELSEDD